MSHPPADLAALLAGLDGAEAALPFVAAVARQLAAPPGAPLLPAAERTAAAGVARVLRLAARLDGVAGAEAPAALLAGDPPLLAAFFQNADLLYDHAFPHADAVSLAVMDAVALLAE